MSNTTNTVSDKLDKYIATDAQMDAFVESLGQHLFVLNGIAYIGQHTVLYARPNTGKTLLTLNLLTDAIQQGCIDSTLIYYVNADDTARGLAEKHKLCAMHGFNQLTPNWSVVKDQAPITPDLIIDAMQTAIDEHEASGMVFILDTLKKFTNIMDKAKSSAFSTGVRAFCQRGGTVISLAHTNKHKDLDNKVVAGGTSDIVDDCDAVYLMDVAVTEDTHTVTFENIKMRADNLQELVMQFDKKTGDSYFDIFDSIRVITPTKSPADDYAVEHKDFIEMIHDALKVTSPILRRELIQNLKADSRCYGGNKTSTVLGQLHEKEWHVTKGKNNLISISLIP